MGATQCFKMENCIELSAYVYCKTPPIMPGDTRGIKLAPYNVIYSEATARLEKSGLQFSADFSDKWAHPIACTLASPDETMSTRGGKDDESNSTYHFVHPTAFAPVVIPEAKKACLSTSAPTLCLPEVYSDAFKSRIEEMQQFHKLMADIPDENKRKR